MIILLYGLSGSGKDTVAEYLSSYYRFKHLKFASALREETYEYYDLDKSAMGDKDYETTPILRLGNRTPTDCLIEYGQKQRKKNPYIWVNKLIDQLHRYQFAHPHFVISDCRQPNELFILRGVFGGVLFRMNRRTPTRPMTSIDKRLDGMADYIIPNNGTIEDLHQYLDELIPHLLSESADFNRVYNPLPKRLLTYTDWKIKGWI